MPRKREKHEKRGGLRCWINPCNEWLGMLQTQKEMLAWEALEMGDSNGFRQTRFLYRRLTGSCHWHWHLYTTFHLSHLVFFDAYSSSRLCHIQKLSNQTFLLHHSCSWMTWILVVVCFMKLRKWKSNWPMSNLWRSFLVSLSGRHPKSWSIIPNSPGAIVSLTEEEYRRQA